MKKITSIIITSYIIFAAQASSAALLTFEDVPGGTQDATGIMPTYQDFDFTSNLYWVDAVRVNPNLNFGALSGEFALVNNGSGSGDITAVGDIDFTFGGLWAKELVTVDDGTPLEGTLSGYNNDIQIWSIETSLNGTYTSFIAPEGFELALIDKLVLDFGNHFLVDDITLNAVPVPPAVWLFGSGLIGLIGVARRKARG